MTDRPVGLDAGSKPTILSWIFVPVVACHGELGMQVAEMFNPGFGRAGVLIDHAISWSVPVVLLGFIVTVAFKAGITRTFPLPLLLLFIGSIAAAILLSWWVDSWPGQEYKAVGAYLYLVTPAVAALGVAAALSEWRSIRRHQLAG